MTNTKIICKTISGIVMMLIVGEVFGGVISRPIAAWRGTNYKCEDEKFLELEIREKADD